MLRLGVALMGCAMLFVSGCGPSAGSTPGGTQPPPSVPNIPPSLPAHTPSPSDQNTFDSFLDTARATQARGPLQPDGRLVAAAQGHADDMSIQNYFSHVSKDGRTLGQRVSATGYRYCVAAENIAKGHTSMAHVFQAWMNSSGHRANILNAKMKDFGLGHAPDGNYWVLVLGATTCN